MSASSDRSLRWEITAGVVALAVLACLFGFVRRRDSAVAQAMVQLRPGMTEAEVQELLLTVRHARLPTPQGTTAYTFYGFDEFVTVVMDGDGEDTHVAKLVHEPDEGPLWDRVRREWDRRFR